MVDRARRMWWKHFLAPDKRDFDLRTRLNEEASGVGDCIRAAQSKVELVDVGTVP